MLHHSPLLPYPLMQHVVLVHSTVCMGQRVLGACMRFASLWSAWGVARCGVGHLTLIDLDHIAESNLNRQVHALVHTLGQAKVVAMAQRIAAINPACTVRAIDDFLTPENAAHYLASGWDTRPDVILDCTDQVNAKVAMVLLARAQGSKLVVCGAAGGKTDPLALRSGDLARANHDALLAKLRHRLRKQHGYPRPAKQAGKAAGRIPAMGVQALWLEQPAILPSAWQAQSATRQASAPQGLSCAGYGSVVMVTAAMGMAAASAAVRLALAASPAG